MGPTNTAIIPHSRTMNLLPNTVNKGHWSFLTTTIMSSDLVLSHLIVTTPTTRTSTCVRIVTVHEYKSPDELRDSHHRHPHHSTAHTTSICHLTAAKAYGTSLHTTRDRSLSPSNILRTPPRGGIVPRKSLMIKWRTVNSCAPPQLSSSQSAGSGETACITVL